MKTKTFWTSDQHIGHVNIIRYCETGATFVRRARWDDDMSPSKVE